MIGREHADALTEALYTIENNYRDERVNHMFVPPALDAAHAALAALLPLAAGRRGEVGAGINADVEGILDVLSSTHQGPGTADGEDLEGCPGCWAQAKVRALAVEADTLRETLAEIKAICDADLDAVHTCECDEEYGTCTPHLILAALASFVQHDQQEQSE